MTHPPNQYTIGWFGYKSCSQYERIEEPTISEAKTSDILGADFSTAAYDALLTTLGVLFPNLGNDPHETDLLDEYEQFSRLHASAVKYLPRVFIDSTDSGLQFSTKAGQWQDESGTWRSVAERLNIAGLTNAVLNYVSYPSTAADATALTISTSAWPTTPHLRVAIITPANSSLTPDSINDCLSMNLLRPVGPVSATSIATALTFTYVDVDGTVSGQPLNIGGSAAGVVMAKAGYIVGSSCRIDSARTAGTLALEPAKATTAGGSFTGLTPTGLDLLIDGTNTLQHAVTISYGTASYDFAAGDRLNFLMTTSAFTPVNADLTAFLWVVLAS